MFSNYSRFPSLAYPFATYATDPLSAQAPRPTAPTSDGQRFGFQQRPQRAALRDLNVTLYGKDYEVGEKAT
jgi:hypothetical protein